MQTEIDNAILERRSVRTFNKEQLIDASKVGELQKAVTAVSSPLGGRWKIQLMDCGEDALAKSPSTYGVIRGATLFLLLWTGSDTVSRISGGYALEQVVLRATHLGLGTCWLGGTFRAKSFGDANVEGMELTIVCPVGVPAQRERLLARAFSAIAGSCKRKPFDELFKFANSVARERFAHPLEMMRLAPSSVNSQPWRAIASDSGVDFYRVGSSKLNDVDLGIGLCHFSLTLPETLRRGRFVSATPGVDAPKNWKYFISYKL
ncbi:MAG: hypothetical protein NC338_08955 [Firmicutes bacterium]|nr:hypothetical protein [Bacillota bacterium]MCM1400507.1 hypothetical protein [Bacteroides sp.]MCM1476865.1 hypothetical protein [Bacteroides sp.]